MSPTSPHVHPLHAREELRADVINLDVSQLCDERFGRGGCSLDPVKLFTAALLFGAPFSNKYVVREIFCEGYAASLGDKKITPALCEILR